MTRILAAIAFCASTALAADPPEYTQAAQLVHQQHWREALSIIDTLLIAHPDNPKVLNLDGLALLGAGRPGDARAAFERALAADAHFSPALKNLAILEWNMGASAVAHTEAALKLNPGDAVLNAYGTLAAIEESDSNAAIIDRFKLAAGAITLMPPRLQYRLGLQLARRGLYPESASIFEDLSKQDPDSAALRYNLALAQYLSGRYREAIGTLEPVRFRRPSSDAMNLLAEAYEKAGETQKAIDTLRKAIEIDPENENNYLDLSNLCADHNAFEQGMQVVKTGLKYKPASARLNFQAGLLLVLSGNYSQAQAKFERAAALEPRNDLPQAAIDLATIQQSRLGDAIADLRRQLTQKPRSGMLWYLLGTALNRTGAADGSPEQQEAISAFRKSLELDSKLPWPRLELGKMYLHLKQPDKAVPLLEQAARMPSVARAAYYQLALAYRELNQPQRSREMLARVKELNDRERASNSFARPQTQTR